MLIWGALCLATIFLFLVAVACFLDYRKHRALPASASVSFLIPCYNDADTIGTSIDSIYSSAPDWLTFEILVADDGSTDGSASHLQKLADKGRITFVPNVRNMGKSRTLNQLVDCARHDIIIFLDADTLLNPEALKDLLARLHDRADTAAVSCPYQPANKGWLPALQSLDYSMISIFQAAYNLTSGLALWGGCIAVRREAFDQAGRFTLTAITEDVELAYKLNRCGWRVEQSIHAVRSCVPQTIKAWVHQKIRWTSGVLQCLFTHPSVWLRNPFQVVLMSLYSALSLNALLTLVRQTLVLDDLFDMARPLLAQLPLPQVASLLKPLFMPMLVGNLQITLCFILLSSIYAIPLIGRWKDIPLLLLVIPFTLVYFPAYSLISAAGFCHLMLKNRVIEESSRAW